VIGLITGCLVDVVAAMSDAFALVYNFHVPLSSKVKKTSHITAITSTKNQIFWYCSLPFGPEPSVFSVAVEKLKN
jgi:hypothetical protein